MNDQIKGLFYFYMMSTRYSFVIFWSILLGILVITLGISYLLKDTDGIMTFSFTFPIVFYVGIYGFYIVKNWLPFLIKIGATRKNIFLSLAIYFTFISLAFSTFASIIQAITTPIIRRLGLDIFSFIHLSQLSTDTWYTRIFIDITIALLFFTISFILTLFFYRYGLAAGFFLLGLIGVTLMFIMYKGLVPDFMTITLPINLSFFVYIALTASVIYCLTWLLLRRMTTLSAH